MRILIACCATLAFAGAAHAANHRVGAPFEQTDSHGRVSLRYADVIAHRGDHLHVQLPAGYTPSLFRLVPSASLKVVKVSDGVATLKLRKSQPLGWQAARLRVVATERDIASAELTVTVRADHEPLDASFVPKL